MTRKEEILKAARDYVDGVISSSPSDVIHFENGAKWADEHPNLESLWHDASEEPNIDEDVVLFDSCGNFVTEFYNGDVTWNNIVLFHKATMWAYKDDLLPKQFGNSKQLKGE